jgi:hypothetical protein
VSAPSKPPGDAGGQKLDVSFGRFLSVGVVAMPLALGGAVLMQGLAGPY